VVESEPSIQHVCLHSIIYPAWSLEDIRPSPAVANADAQLCFLRMHRRVAPAARVNQCEEAPHASQILP
jgi:hypothetical protein